MTEHMSGHGMGRLPAPDERDAQYPMLAHFLAAPIAEPTPRTRPWPMFYAPLDQGHEGTCVGHGWKHRLMAAPLCQTSPTRAPTAVQIYDLATDVDEFPGNEHDRSAGTSVRAGAKALQQLGFIQSYVWAQSMADVDRFLDGYGPVVIGINWYPSMFQTRDDGVLVIPHSQFQAGGHCVMLDWRDAKRGVYWGPNSWGRSIGRLNPKTGKRNGRIGFSREDLEWLLFTKDGECCAPTEIKHTPGVA